MQNGLLTGAAGQINGTTSDSHNITRVGVGTGVYSLGAPRQIEFGLRLTNVGNGADCWWAIIARTITALDNPR